MAARRRAEMVEETREKLIQAARTAFTEKGYAAASMDELTASAGLTRGALYHNFGDKKGLLRAVIDEMDKEIFQQMRVAREQESDLWRGFQAECLTYIRSALRPDVQRIMLLDGPAVLGDPSTWPNQNTCLITTMQRIELLAAEGVFREVDAEAAARLVNGAALNAALWIAAAAVPEAVFPRAVAAFEVLISGLRCPS